MSRSGPEKTWAVTMPSIRHLYITSFALRCADGTEKVPVLGSIYLKSTELLKAKEDDFSPEKRQLEKVDRLIRRLEIVITCYSRI